MNKRADVELNKLYSNIYGDYRIIEDLGVINHTHFVKIRFEDINIFGFQSEIIVHLSNVTTESNNIKDPYREYSDHRRGCVGIITPAMKAHPQYKRIYYLWFNMIRRCTDPENDSYNWYGGNGVSICQRWLCFEFFFYDVQNLPGYDLWLNNKGAYELDKDILFPGNKLYAPDRCMFVKSSVNNADFNIRKNANKENYLIGVREKESGNYAATFCKIPIGTYTDPIAAASMYNHFARYNGYPEQYLNNLGDSELSIHDANQLKIPPNKKNGKYQLYKLLNVSKCK